MYLCTRFTELFWRFVSIGKMAERLNAAVLKTVDLHGSGGSNPSLSAEWMDGWRVLAVLFLVKTDAI